VSNKRICEVDMDTAAYVGDETDGVYYAVAHQPRGKAKGWYVSTVVDCNSSSFCQPLITDDGPYATEAEAWAAGMNGARDWCIENDVRYDEDDEPNLVDRIENAIRTDTDNSVRNSERIRDKYLEASEDARTVVDDIFISLCGYSLHTLIAGEEDK
jgi:hypothetical protein